jgi:sugar lactone lactonase YvrE
VKFSKDGKFMRAWGKTGSRPGELYIPHSIAMDSKGRLFVADRGNSRIQIFDQDGTFIDQWKQFGRPSGLYIDKNDTLYVADSHSNATLNPGFKRGLRVGSARDGYVTAFVPFVERMSEDAARASGRFSIAEAEAALGSTWAELTAMGYTLADLNNNAGWEGVAADAEGNIYAAGTTTNMVLKFVRATNAN